MSLRSRCVGVIIARPTTPVTKRPGGQRLVSIQPVLRVRYGWKLIHCRQFRTKRRSPKSPTALRPRAVGGLAYEGQITNGSQLRRRPTLNDLPSGGSMRIAATHAKALAPAPKKSRCNAVRHGLTAETVIDALEDARVKPLSTTGCRDRGSMH